MKWNRNQKANNNETAVINKYISNANGISVWKYINLKDNGNESNNENIEWLQWQ